MLSGGLVVVPEPFPAAPKKTMLRPSLLLRGDTTNVQLKLGGNHRLSHSTQCPPLFVTFKLPLEATAVDTFPSDSSTQDSSAGVRTLFCKHQHNGGCDKVDKDVEEKGREGNKEENTTLVTRL
jgi:hypothetical protein